MHWAIDGSDKVIEKKKQFHIPYVFNTEQILINNLQGCHQEAQKPERLLRMREECPRPLFEQCHYMYL
jgi:hypothetical protein